MDSRDKSRSVAIVPLTFEVSPSFMVNFTVHHVEVILSLFDLVFKIGCEFLFLKEPPFPLFIS